MVFSVGGRAVWNSAWPVAINWADLITGNNVHSADLLLLSQQRVGLSPKILGGIINFMTVIFLNKTASNSLMVNDLDYERRGHELKSL